MSADRSPSRPAPTDIKDRCDCADWKENIGKVDGLVTLAAVHGFMWTGRPFRHCPWCGTQLREMIRV